MAAFGVTGDARIGQNNFRIVELVIALFKQDLQATDEIILNKLGEFLGRIAQFDLNEVIVDNLQVMSRPE